VRIAATTPRCRRRALLWPDSQRQRRRCSVDILCGRHAGGVSPAADVEPPLIAPPVPLPGPARARIHAMSMISGLLTRIFGSRNQRLLSSTSVTSSRINALEPQTSALSDEQLKAKTDEFRGRVAGGEALEPVAAEAFAVVREAARRTLGMRHFDVQLIGGMVLHDGKIAEMRTGEGKTLTATLAVYLNALSGKGVHVVTVNDYLATRDAEWMGRVYSFLGMTVGVIVSQQPNDEKRAAYAAEHHLRHQQRVRLRLPAHNMEYSVGGQAPARAELRHRRTSGLHPDRRGTHALIISGPAEDHTELYRRNERRAAAADATARGEG